MKHLFVLTVALVAAGCEPEAVTLPEEEGGEQIDAAVAAPEVTPVIDEFLASSQSIPAGATVELSYRVRDAQTVTIAIEGGQTLLPATTLLEWRFSTPPLQANSTFVLTAMHSGRAVTSTVAVEVAGGGPVGPALHASIQQFATSSIDIQVGESATLSWATTNAAQGHLLANDQEMLAIPTIDLASGMQVVSPGTTTVYTLAVTGTDGQEVTAVTAVNVASGGVILGGRELFDRNVQPILELRCAFCHSGQNVVDGPDFMGALPIDFYASITADARFLPARPDDSLLLLKGEHTGPAFTEAEAQTVTAWLLKEADERGLVVPGEPELPPQDYTPRTVAEALTRFGACMSRTDWDETYGLNENTQVAYQNTTEGRCYACHSTGTAGAFLSQSSGDTFELSRERPYVLKYVLPTANEDGSFRALVPAYRFRDKGGDQGHPSYQLTAERAAALDTFVDRTLLRFSDFTIACP